MKPNKTYLSKIILVIVILAFVWIVSTHFAQTTETFAVLASGRWYWITLAVLCQIFFYPFYAYILEYIFTIFRAKIALRDMLPVYIASKFTDVALPIATIGQVMLFARNGKRYGVLPLNAGIGISFAKLFDTAAFGILSILTIAVLYFFREPRTYLIVSLLILAGAIILAILFLCQLAIEKTPPNRLVLWIIKMITKVAGRDVTREELEEIFLETGDDLVRGKGRIKNALLLSFAAHLINLVTFAFIYLAFAGTFNPLAILAGYVACLLFTIVSITPQGVGVAEAIMIGTIHSFGADLSVATVVTLAFRGLLYWLPLFPGFYFFSHLEIKGDTKKNAPQIS